jgi:excisionase family DNA binding protein
VEENLPDKAFFSVADIKAMGLMSDTTFYKEVALGRIVAHKFGRSTRVSRENLVAYLQAAPTIQPKRQAA